MNPDHKMLLDQKATALLDLSRALLGAEATVKVAQALELAKGFHHGQVRKLDGSPYVTHCIEVAHHGLSWGMTDVAATCAALLHDAIEDAPEEMEAEHHLREFDEHVYEIVKSLSKIRSIQTGGGDLPATYRRILGAASKDLRVLIIKIFDVYQNSASLNVHGKTNAKNKASLALIYVGVARRLGIIALADALIERILPHLMPVQYDRAKATLEGMLKRGEAGMERIIPELGVVLREGLAESFVIESRTVGDYFVLTEQPGTGQLMRIGWPTYRLRLLVEEDEAAWRVLGKMHSHFGPLPRHIRDYLNAPRVNGFHALTTRIIWDEHPLTVQVVRKRDDKANRLGILAEWGVSGPDTNRYMRLLATLGDSDLRMSEVHAHVLPDMLDVYTPKGDRLTFPVDAVVVDFAYLVHTELGEHCIGARINGIQYPPEHPLHDGDVVRVLTSKQARPQRSWLDVVKTARARTLIKQALKNPDIPVKGISRPATGQFQVTELGSPDILWSTCCLAVPGVPIVGRISEDAHWIVHRSQCNKIQHSQWESGSWAIGDGRESLHVTFTVGHRTGALLSVLKLIAQYDINGHSIQGKGRSTDSYLISMELDGQPPSVLGLFLSQLVLVSSVQEVLNYTWKA
ncbi:MAG: bifunctional (p)ppGpp synthetase/guanosine-3',5'-bis(diphosphate) 3'-pyrophosphohydrolase [Magnetococcales bacterium]|nr:bifunctional (p)ppGpp synthetase/guanosine-3',5'-bis(diphosphate) 3'-pyrophosphohydrolase [Magnetococcales bacterium]MBF0584142.1 bifunctional (p)ppGpp synthetase/guanosine-3',5'-bis(diphosphate) 3'-pyrophosphohydrolase [Magnetococcales bacterium]